MGPITSFAAVLRPSDPLRAFLAVERPREHAVDAEVFAQLTECSLNMLKRGQAANQVSMTGTRQALMYFTCTTER